MLETGTRLKNNFYVKTAFDPDTGDCYVTVEFKTNEGVEHIMTGQVTWDE